MGFYIRKSLRVGPFRFNLSRSGIGISAGITGLRFGSGPRGNYVHMGRGGVYFRKTLSSPKSRKRAPASTPAWVEEPRRTTPSQRTIPLSPDPTVGEFTEIDSGSVSEMTSASAGEFLEELNEKRRRIRITPFAVIAAILAMVFLWSQEVSSIILVLAAIFLSTCVFLGFWKDQIRKSVVVFYTFEPELEKAYGDVYEAFTSIVGCKRVRHVESSARVLDRKYHAGASTLSKMTGISPRLGGVPFLKTNILVPLVPAGRQTLAFMPDRLLVFEPNAVGAVEYNDLRFGIEETNFIEDQGVPRGTQVVGRTWRYVNKKGGPDRRFKNNAEIPIVRYETIAFLSHTGLNEMIQCSSVGVGVPFEASVRRLASHVGKGSLA